MTDLFAIERVKRSVPPAVAGGFVIVNTRPLPQAVLT